jgi:hypothetical protein
MYRAQIWSVEWIRDYGRQDLSTLMDTTYDIHGQLHMKKLYWMLWGDNPPPAPYKMQDTWKYCI